MRAAEQNFRVAQKSVGDCYFNGCGVEQNDMLAFQWYLQSAERGFPVAQLVVGDCYRAGRGVEKNEAEAMKWYDLAAKTGIVSARKKLAEMQGGNL